MKKRIHMRRKLFAFLLMICIMMGSFTSVFAAEAEETEFYITEETTHWDVVEATDPNHDEIPDEIKQQMKESYVLSRNWAPAMYIAVSNKSLIVFCIGIVFAFAAIIFRVISKRK